MEGQVLGMHKAAIAQLVIVRHGESTWNSENKFTGWTDVDLSDKGFEESRIAGRILSADGIDLKIAFTSVLKRSIKTLNIILDEMDLAWIPVIKTWRLNEKYYGALQGANKRETAKKYGERQVELWRRSYDVRPPEIDKTDDRYPRNDPRYDDLEDEQIPTSECLKDTVARFLPCWENQIARELRAGRNVLIVAHGNSLRALTMHLENVPTDEIMKLNLPTGIPKVYDLDKNLKPVQNKFLGDAKKVEAAIKKVANQGRIRSA